MTSEQNFSERLFSMSPRDVWHEVRSNREFAEQYRRFSYEVWRRGSGLRTASIVPCSWKRETFRVDLYAQDRGTVFSGGYAIGHLPQDAESSSFQLFGFEKPVDIYYFLAALASGGIAGDTLVVEGYSPDEMIIIPVLERGDGRFVATDIVMEAGAALNMAQALERHVGNP